MTLENGQHSTEYSIVKPMLDLGEQDKNIHWHLAVGYSVKYCKGHQVHRLGLELETTICHCFKAKKNFTGRIIA